MQAIFSTLPKLNRSRHHAITTPKIWQRHFAFAESGVSIRTVLLKTVDQQGFVFFTNYNSKKSKQISSNPKVALLFPWLDINKPIMQAIFSTLPKLNRSRHHAITTPKIWQRHFAFAKFSLHCIKLRKQRSAFARFLGWLSRGAGYD
jgi:hypothetical protein